MIVIATWPVLIKLQKIFWGKRWIAVLLMTLLLLLLFIIPIALVIGSLIDNSGPVLEWASSAKNWSIPDLLWLKSIPAVGHKLYNSWHSMLAGGGSIIIAKIQPYIWSNHHLVCCSSRACRFIRVALFPDAAI
ncbi:putative inner membrane protein [Hafnia alvei]|uniref:Putative inner membrane protein n=1 Tax=Hafnia alvei TaxID=569 RepID=A0A377PK44_HAFAL|nr:putative inner membrane protein [Hafnia alvei]